MKGPIDLGAGGREVMYGLTGEGGESKGVRALMYVCMYACGLVDLEVRRLS